MSILKTAEYPIEEKVRVRGAEIALKGKLTAPFGFNPRTLARNIEGSLNALGHGNGQAVLDFENVFSIGGDGPEFKLVCDKPNPRRKKLEFRVEVDVSGEKGMELQSTIYNAAQTEKKLTLKVSESNREVEPEADEEDAADDQSDDQEESGGEELQVNKNSPLEGLIPEKWAGQLAKNNITTVGEILAFDGDHEKLSKAVPGLAYDDAQEMIGLVHELAGVESEEETKE